MSPQLKEAFLRHAERDDGSRQDNISTIAPCGQGTSSASSDSESASSAADGTGAEPLASRLALRLDGESEGEFSDTPRAAPCHPALLQGPGVLDNEDALLEERQGLASDEGGEPTARQHRASRAPQLGVSSKGWGTSRRYLARMSVFGIWLLSRMQPSLEMAVFAHMVFMQIRDGLLSMVQRLGLAPDWMSTGSLDAILGEAEKVVDAALADAGVDGSVGFCSFSANISMRPFLGVCLNTPHTRSIAKCLAQKQRVLQARAGGWSKVRAVWLDMTASHAEPRLARARSRSVEEVERLLDAAYAHYAPKRAAREQRLADQHQKRVAREAAQLDAANARTTRKFDRIRGHAERLLQVVKARELREAEKANVTLQKRLREEARRNEYKRRQAAEARWKWISRRDLTMEEILRGPPVQ